MTHEAKSAVTIKTVAAAAGVSIGTVSRVLNGTARVSPEATEKVMQAIKALKFVPSFAAQSIRSSRSRMIACAVPDITNSLYAGVVEGITHTLEAHNYGLIVLNTGHKVERELKAIDAARRYDADGMIFIGGRLGEERVEEALTALAIPVQTIERTFQGPNSVSVDHADGIRKLMKLLWDYGHRRIGLITSGAELLPSRNRINAYRAFLAEHGVGIDETLIRPSRMTEADGYNAIHALMALEHPPSAAVCIGAHLQSGVHKYLHQSGLSIPIDLSLAVIGDEEIAASIQPPITVLQWDAKDVGRLAAEGLLTRIEGGQDQALIRIPCTVVVRNSIRKIEA